MPDFGKILFSPPVIIGGVAIGAFLLLTSKPAAASSPASGGPSAAQLSAYVQTNHDAMAQQVQLAQISASTGVAALNADNISQGQMLSFLTNINNNNTVVQGKLIDSHAGITQAQIASSTALALDVQNNMTDLQKTYSAANVAEAGYVAQENIANSQLKAATKVANDNLIGSIFGSVAKVATAGIF